MPISQAAFASSPLARINAARRLAATLFPLCMDAEQEVRAAGYKQTVSSLEAYEKGQEAAVAQIDDGRESYLVMREAFIDACRRQDAAASRQRIARLRSRGVSAFEREDEQ